MRVCLRACVCVRQGKEVRASNGDRATHTKLGIQHMAYLGTTYNSAKPASRGKRGAGGEAGCGERRKLARVSEPDHKKPPV